MHYFCKQINLCDLNLHLKIDKYNKHSNNAFIGSVNKYDSEIFPWFTKIKWKQFFENQNKYWSCTAYYVIVISLLEPYLIKESWYILTKNIYVQIFFISNFSVLFFKYICRINIFEIEYWNYWHAISLCALCIFVKLIIQYRCNSRHFLKLFDRRLHRRTYRVVFAYPKTGTELNNFKNILYINLSLHWTL